MMSANRVLPRRIAPLKHQVHHFAKAHLLSASRNLSKQPSEADIVQDLRRGNFERGVLRFCKRPRSERSNELHETLILACAQVPDATAAAAVLRAMPQPTPSAVHHVVTALCRERNVRTAIDVLEKLPDWGLPVDQRMVVGVMRAARRDGFDAVENQMKRIEKLSKKANSSGKRAQPTYHVLSAADFFVEDGGDGDAWLKAVREGLPGSAGVQSRRFMKKAIAAEAALRASRGDVSRVVKAWANIQVDPHLKGDAGLLAAAVSAFIGCGSEGGVRALNTFMTWIREHLYDEATGRGIAEYTKNASAIAFLVTSATKVLAAAARPAPQLALSAFDALWELDLPQFSSSLPLTGAYFKVLQHADLSLTETKDRINRVRRNHIQLDEQGFSMALGAILRCDARVLDKLAAGRQWVEVMQSAGIPLTVHTYNLFAGQLRYCNNPELVTTLLSDMTSAGVIPTPVTYGLVFSACVIPGDYSSSARKNAVPVAVWERVLEAMEEHRMDAGVNHTANSRLSLARAYAHLGKTGKALREFDSYVALNKRFSVNNTVSYSELGDAYNQMIHNFAHCRDCSADGPHAAITVYEMMCKAGFPISGSVLDSLFVACIRTGRGQEAVDFAAANCEVDPTIRLSQSGLKHLLMGHVEVCDPKSWERTRRLVLNNLDVLASPQLLSTVHKLIISFARNQEREVCNDIMNLTGVEIPNLDYIVNGREFLRFRSQGSAQKARVAQSKTGAAQPSKTDPVHVRSFASEGSQINPAVLIDDGAVVSVT